jgi:hypothetical protein
MKARSAALQGGLAVLGLIAAFATWQRPKETAKKEGVTLVEASKASLERVAYEDGTRSLTVEKKDRLEVTLAWLPGKRPVVDAGIALVDVPDAGVDGGTVVAAAKPAEPAPDRTVYASERGDDLWAKFTPFEATRALGPLSKEKLDELGLTGSERKLELRVAGATRRFTLSKPVPGLIGAYAQDEKGEVYLLPSSLFALLDPTSGVLIDRRLHTFKQAEFDAFSVAADGKKADFVQTGAEIPQTAKVARAATPGTPDELAKNWHEKIWNRLVVTEVLGLGELPKHGEPTVQLRLEYAQKGKAKGWLELGLDSTQGTWARSENTPGWVAIHQGAEELVIEGKRLAAQ